MNAYVHARVLEFREDRELRQKGWIGSILVHVLLVALLFVVPQLATSDEGLTEFTWLEETTAVEEPVDVPAPSAKAAAEQPVIEEKPAPTPTSPARFERVEVEEAEVEPRPQSLTARDDRLSDRLSALRENRPNIAIETPQVTSLLKAPATEMPKSTSMDKKELVRNAGIATAAPSELRRDRTLSRTPTLATARPTTNVRRTAIIPPDANLTVRRTLAGAALAGPAADRPIRKYIMPEYPEWAKLEGVEGSVTLGFVVMPDGRVKANVMVHRTSGYEDFDRRAQQAIRLWRFEALPSGSTQEQWGTITMHFRLRS